MKKGIVFVVFLIAVFFFISCNTVVKKDIKVVSAQDIHKLIQNSNIQLIDVRTPKEFNTEHIEGAKNFNFFSPHFLDSIKTLNSNTPIAVYCHSGKRSTQSRAVLLKAGFYKIYDLKGGITAWKKAGLNTITN